MFYSVTMNSLAVFLVFGLIVRSQGSLDEIWDRCCLVGSQLAETEAQCQYAGPLTDISDNDHPSCNAIIEVCCMKRLHVDKCSAGEQDALNNHVCVIRDDDYGAEQYQECCQCCRLGLIARSAGLPCDFTKIGGPCDDMFQKCCLKDDAETSEPEEETDDRDECTLFPGSLCDHRCINTIGSYRCECNTGFELQTDGKSCKAPEAPEPEVRDRCVTNNPCQQLCTDTGISVKCSCNPGYELDSDGKTCNDLDECSQNPSQCPLDTHCQNTEGSYRCQPIRCPEGYIYSPSSMRCEIDLYTKCPTGTVYNPLTRRCERRRTPGRECQDGFRFNIDSNLCEDINECASLYNSCQATQRCVNTVGSHRCIRLKDCGTGYTLDERSQRCIDVDECVLNTHNCGTGYECSNIDGSFRCYPKDCPEGYRINLSNGQCEVIVCAPGHRPDRSGNCVDFNECIENPNICSRTEQCINSIGSYICRSLINCPGGYEVDPSATRCVDIDECAIGSHTCLQTQECRNMPGTFICQCPNGYKKAPTGHCEDIDECSHYGGQVCASNSECQNTHGSYRCSCNVGFLAVPESNSCTDQDECADEYRCEHECVNTYGSFQCTCREGYKLSSDNRRCEDVDECSQFTGVGRLCIGECNNIQGSYTCSCPNGYRMMGDRRTCEDVDECTEGGAHCGGNSVCTNTKGGFKCQQINCPRGFYKAHTASRGKSVRCQRKSFVCQPGDQECLTNPLLSYSYNFLTFPSLIHVPADLFTMSGPQTDERRMEFELNLKSARALRAGVRRATRNLFTLRLLAPNKAVVSLLQEIPGPQDLELELDMDLYGVDNTFFGTARAKIFLYVTANEFL